MIPLRILGWKVGHPSNLPYIAQATEKTRKHRSISDFRHEGEERMSENTETRVAKPILSLAMLLAGSLLVGFSMGRWLAPLAAWIGPVLIMRFARDHRAGRGYLLVLAANIVAFVIGFGAMWSHWGLPAVPILAVLYGILWSLPYLADRLVSPRLRGFSSTLVYPLAATTLEFVNIHTNPLGTWGATGFTQYGDLPLMQLASVTGMIGITFLMGWFASVANWVWENRSRGGELVRGVALFGVVFAAVFLFGSVRLNLAPTSETGETVRVAGITSQGLDSLSERTADDPSVEAVRPLLQSFWEAYFAQTVREAQAGAQVILWPEVNAPTFPADETSYIAQAQEVARQNGIYLALPVGVNDPDKGQWTENKLLLIDPTGAIVMEHYKYGGSIIETSRVGDGKLQTVATPFGALSGVICYDLDYPAVIQQTGQNGTGLLLVPSKDWFEIDPVHTHMAVFRAIENGMSLVRQTDTGLSIAVDAYGRVLAQTDFFGATDRTMVAQVPVRHVATLYTAFGRWVEWLAPIGFLFLVAWAFIARRQVK
jgi:apolipoprotein N-acyltransferase